MVQRFAAANANLIVQVAENKTRTASTVTTAVGVGEEEMGKSRSLRSSSLGSCHQMPQRTMFEKHSGDVAISRYNSSRIGTVASLEDLDLSHSLMPPKRKRRFDNIKAQRLLDRAADWNVLARNLKQGKGVVEIHGHLAEEVVVIVPGQGIGVIEMTMTGGDDVLVTTTMRGQEIGVKVAAATVTVVTVTVETAIEVIVTGETAIEVIVTVLIVVAIEVIVGIETGMKEKNEMRATLVKTLGRPKVIPMTEMVDVRAHLMACPGRAKRLVQLAMPTRMHTNEFKMPGRRLMKLKPH